MKNVKRKASSGVPVISTASLPDIVFILLFFFMTVATIKNEDIMVQNELPFSSEGEVVNKLDRVIDIFVGPGTSGKQNDDNTVLIQIDNRLINKDEVGYYAIQSLGQMPEHLRKVAVVALKADRNIKLGIINDIKKQLISVNLLKINYSTVQGDVNTTF